MKKGIWFLVIVLFIAGVVYNSFNFSSSVEGSPEQEGETGTSLTEVKLTNGEMMSLIREEAALQASSGQKKVVLTELGMTCPNCKDAVSAGLKSTKGIVAFYVNLLEDRATVVFDPNQVNMEAIKQSVADVGYQVGEVKEVQ
jgi:copper chaperone CopZ